jgi:hypothetical protein
MARKRYGPEETIGKLREENSRGEALAAAGRRVRENRTHGPVYEEQPGSRKGKAGRELLDFSFSAVYSPADPVRPQIPS